MEMLSAKTTWVKEILNSIQQNINDPKIANILLGVEFILDSLLADAQTLNNTFEQLLKKELMPPVGDIRLIAIKIRKW